MILTAYVSALCIIDMSVLYKLHFCLTYFSKVFACDTDKFGQCILNTVIGAQFSTVFEVKFKSKEPEIKICLTWSKEL